MRGVPLVEVWRYKELRRDALLGSRRARVARGGSFGGGLRSLFCVGLVVLGALGDDEGSGLTPGQKMPTFFRTHGQKWDPSEKLRPLN